ncbi:MAG: proteasome subunit beta [archaeon]|nr:proteasome subunit beta [archaeon]
MSQISVPGACSVAIKCKDAVILGNDNRVIWGYTVTNKSTKKVFSITETTGMTCYGLVGDFQTLVKIMRANAELYELREGVPLSVKAIAKMVANYLYQRKQAPLLVNICIAGIDNEGPQVWPMDIFGGLGPEDYSCGGTAMSMAVGILESEYKPDMTVEAGLKLIEKTIKAAVTRDAMTGNGMDLLIIKKDGIEEKSIVFTEIGE